MGQEDQDQDRQLCNRLADKSRRGTKSHATNLYKLYLCCIEIASQIMIYLLTSVTVTVNPVHHGMCIYY